MRIKNLLILVHNNKLGKLLRENRGARRRHHYHHDIVGRVVVGSVAALGGTLVLSDRAQCA